MSEATKVFLNGATIMSTPTPRLLAVARDAGFDGVEVRAERLLDAPDEVAATAAAVRPGEVWSLNGIQLQVGPDGGLDRERLGRDLPPRLAICRAVGAQYLLVVPPRMAGLDVERTIEAMREGLAIAQRDTAPLGIGLAFEFLGFGDCPIDTPALAARVAGGVPGIDLVVDSCHWHASGSGSLAGFPVERLAMVHVNDAPAKAPRDVEDADRVLPGDGFIRLADLLGELRQRGYAGPYSLETFNPAYWVDDPASVAGRGHAALARLLGEGRPMDAGGA